MPEPGQPIQLGDPDPKRQYEPLRTVPPLHTKQSHGKKNCSFGIKENILFIYCTLILRVLHTGYQQLVCDHL